jgi:hypothetical protein
MESLLALFFNMDARQETGERKVHPSRDKWIGNEFTGCL